MDGNLSFSDNSGIVGSSKLDGSWYSTKGYTNPLICYLDIAESYVEEYTVECGDGFEIYSQYQYIEKLDDISEIYKEIIRLKAKGEIEDYINSSYSLDEAKDLKVVGEYLLTAKSQGNDIKNNNKYIVVFSATVSSAYKRFEPMVVYFPVEYDGIVKLPGDNYMTTVSGGILGNSKIPDTWDSVDGYIDGEEMYSAIITSNRDKYKYEVSEELKVFGE